MNFKLSKNDQLFISNTRKRVGKALHQYKLIKKDDAILIGVSGGKDSYFLLDALVHQQKVLPFNISIKAIHIHVDDAPYEIDFEFLASYCKQHNVPLIKEHIQLGNLEESKKSPCFVCSWKRRKALFEAVEQLNCNKLALGHHMDDAIETLLLNMTYHGEISSMPAQVNMFKGKFSIIRPLLLVEEQNIIQYSKLVGFPDEITLCPFEEKGNRLEMKKIVKKLSQVAPKARINIFRSMEKIESEYLPKKL